MIAALSLWLLLAVPETDEADSPTAALLEHGYAVWRSYVR